MKMNLWIAMASLTALPLLLVLVGQLGWLSGPVPTDLGIDGDRLKAPSQTRNSVSSQAALDPNHPQAAYAQVDPLPLLGATPSESMAALNTVLAAQPGVQVLVSNDAYIRATARTPWLGFVDDMEFWFNPARQVIEVRSASRLGREDFGVNRARLERIRSAYVAAATTQP